MCYFDFVPNGFWLVILFFTYSKNIWYFLSISGRFLPSAINVRMITIYRFYQVQALFPPQALTKRIRVGLQAHGANGAVARRVLPRHAAVSPVLTVEPRRRKFHRSITLTVPLPHPADQKVNKNMPKIVSFLRFINISSSFLQHIQKTDRDFITII